MNPPLAEKLQNDLGESVVVFFQKVPRGHKDNGQEVFLFRSLSIGDNMGINDDPDRIYDGPTDWDLEFERYKLEQEKLEQEKQQADDAVEAPFENQYHDFRPTSELENETAVTPAPKPKPKPKQASISVALSQG